MIRLATSSESEILSLPVIAKEEKISAGYLEKIFSKLKKAKLIKARLGVSGGYILAQAPRDITVLAIITALEDNFSPFHCSSKSGKIYCKSNCRCDASGGFLMVEEAIRKTLKNIKLSDLLKN